MVGTVLLILIVVGAGLLIFNFVVPFIKENLGGTKCFETVGQIRFSNSKYTCFDDKNDGTNNNDEINLQVHFGENKSLEGFIIELGGVSSRSINIKNGVSLSEVKMFGGSYEGALELPGKNEERTYVIQNSRPDYAKIYALVDGKSCDVSDTITKLDDCQ